MVFKGQKCFTIITKLFLTVKISSSPILYIMSMTSSINGKLYVNKVEEKISDLKKNSQYTNMYEVRIG